MVQCAFSWDCYYETDTHCDRALNSKLLIVNMIVRDSGLKSSKKESEQRPSIKVGQLYQRPTLSHLPHHLFLEKYFFPQSRSLPTSSVWILIIVAWWTFESRVARPFAFCPFKF